MLTLDTDCTDCDATGKKHTGRERVPLLPDRSSWDPEALRETVVIDPTRDHEIETCHSCKGLAIDGVTYARYRDKYDTYGQPYKNESGIKAAITRGKATVCKSCRGLGQIVYVPTIDECYTCSGRGKRVTWNPDVDPILPPEVSDCDSASDEFMAAWLKSATIIVVREDREQTWNEAHLGLGGLWSSTDYGRAAAMTDEEIIAMVSEKVLTDRTQYIKMLDRPTRRFGTVLAIRVHRQGYVPTVADVRRARPLLPPTYTDDVLNRPRHLTPEETFTMYATYVINGRRDQSKPYKSERNLFRHGVPSNARRIRIHHG